HAAADCVCDWSDSPNWNLTSFLRTRDQFDAQGCQRGILICRQSADANRADDFAILQDRKAAAPSDESGIAIVGNIVASFLVPDFVPNVLGRLAFAGGGPGVVGRDADSQARCSIHAREGPALTIGVLHRADGG